MTRVDPGMFAGFLMQGLEQGRAASARRMERQRQAEQDDFAQQRYGDALQQQDIDNQYRQGSFDRGVLENDRNFKRLEEQDALRFNDGLFNQYMDTENLGLRQRGEEREIEALNFQQEQEKAQGEIHRSLNLQILQGAGGMSQGSSFDPQGSMLVPQEDLSDQLANTVKYGDARAQRALTPVLQNHTKRLQLEGILQDPQFTTAAIADPELRLAAEIARATNDPANLAQALQDSRLKRAMMPETVNGQQMGPPTAGDSQQAAIIGALPAQDLQKAAIQRMQAQQGAQSGFDNLRAMFPNGNPNILQGVANREAMGKRVDLPEVSVTGQTRQAGNVQGAATVYRQLAARYKALNEGIDTPPTAEEIQIASGKQPDVSWWSSDYHDEYPAIKAKVETWNQLKAVEGQLLGGGGAQQPQGLQQGGDPNSEDAMIDQLLLEGYTDEEIDAALRGN